MLSGCSNSSENTPQTDLDETLNILDTVGVDRPDNPSGSVVNPDIYHDSNEADYAKDTEFIYNDYNQYESGVYVDGANLAENYHFSGIKFNTEQDNYDTDIPNINVSTSVNTDTQPNESLGANSDEVEDNGITDNTETDSSIGNSGLNDYYEDEYYEDDYYEDDYYEDEYYDSDSDYWDDEFYVTGGNDDAMDGVASGSDEGDERNEGDVIVDTNNSIHDTEVEKEEIEPVPYVDPAVLNTLPYQNATGKARYLRELNTELAKYFDKTNQQYIVKPLDGESDSEALERSITKTNEIQVELSKVNSGEYDRIIQSVADYQEYISKLAELENVSNPNSYITHDYSNIDYNNNDYEAVEVSNPEQLLLDELYLDIYYNGMLLLNGYSSVEQFNMDNENTMDYEVLNLKEKLNKIEYYDSIVSYNFDADSPIANNWVDLKTILISWRERLLNVNSGDEYIDAGLKVSEVDLIAFRKLKDTIEKLI